MQLHDWLQTAPALMRLVHCNSIIVMQNHAPYACMLKMRGPPEKNQQKSGKRRQ
ncbi:acetyl xylan esterase [Serratia marcescens]|nr:acetyl xylan esterase [Serratia marcescens]TXE38010.1 acetyl xylan esterase [Serratia marcescens]